VKGRGDGGIHRGGTRPFRRHGVGDVQGSGHRGVVVLRVVRGQFR